MNWESPGTLVIAEAGVNHDGSVHQARRLVDVAAEAGADAVKFQTFKADSLVTARAPKAEYQERSTGRAQSQMEMLDQLELSRKDHEVLLEHCTDSGIDFLSTPFDSESARFLAVDLGLDTIKIPSGEITNAPLLLAIARHGKQMIVSTGMCNLGEIEMALGVLAFGLMDQEHDEPRSGDFRAAYESEAGHRLLCKNVTLLHCTTEYPAPHSSVNLRALDTLRCAFGLRTGLSDHTPGITVPLAAVAREAVMIEKHFTLDRTLAGPDHAASLEPKELEEMVEGIRQVEDALGDGRKVPTEAERKNKAIVRRGLVARRPIAKGQEIGPTDLVAKRPMDGLSPMFYWSLIGSIAQRDYARDEPIREAVLDEGQSR